MREIKFALSWRGAQGGLTIRMVIGIVCERMRRQRMVGAPWSLNKGGVCGTFRKEEYRIRRKLSLSNTFSGSVSSACFKKLP